MATLRYQRVRLTMDLGFRFRVVGMESPVEFRVVGMEFLVEFRVVGMGVLVELRANSAVDLGSSLDFVHHHINRFLGYRIHFARFGRSGCDVPMDSLGDFPTNFDLADSVPVLAIGIDFGSELDSMVQHLVADLVQFLVVLLVGIHCFVVRLGSETVGLRVDDV